MPTRTNLLAAAALLALALPAVAHADDTKKEHGGQQQAPHAAAPKPPPQQPHAAMPQGQPHAGAPQGQPRSFGQGQPHQMAAPHPGGMQQHHDAIGRAPAPAYQANPGYAGHQGHEGFAPGHEGFAGESHERMAPSAHVEMRDHWRADHGDWRDHAVWGHDHYWWRGNPAFSAYTGPRASYYFAPGFGYYHVPSIYWGRHWGVGAFLPLFFLTYAVADYAAYGLPPPPPGTAWVWVNNNLLLINQSDGYVLDEVGNVW